MHAKPKLATLALLLAVAPPARAQFGDLVGKLKDRAQETVERRAEQKTEETTNQAIDAATAGKKSTAQEQARTPPPKQGGDAATAKSASGEGDAGKATGAPAAGEVYANQFDFVPGDKVLFFEDFADTSVGEYPVRWTRKGIGGGSSIEVIDRAGKHWLRLAKGDTGDSKDFIRAEFQDLPAKFTLEFDAFLDPGTNGFEVETDGNYMLQVHPNGASTYAGTSVSWAERKGVRRVSISVSDTYLKLYIDGERALIDPDGVTRPLKRLGMSISNPWTKEAPVMFTNLRLAEGGKDYRKELVSLGRIVTHGITFDTGSDALRPESGPTLRGILEILQQDAQLRFEIQGHTDSQGGPKVNQPLSERRAAAVKAWFVKQGVAEARLRTKGLADTKPIDSNDTQEGRANNRRVEFLKL